MFARHIILLAAAQALIAGACENPSDPGDTRATVVVQRDTLVASVDTAGGVEWMRFTIPVLIRNSSSVPLSFKYCASTIDAPMGDDWTPVWSPICTVSADAPTDIQPDETREVALSILAAISGPGGPLWQSASVNGAYRLSLAFIPAGGSGIIPRVGSNRFTLLQGN